MRREVTVIGAMPGIILDEEFPFGELFMFIVLYYVSFLLDSNIYFFD